MGWLELSGPSGVSGGGGAAQARRRRAAALALALGLHLALFAHLAVPQAAAPVPPVVALVSLAYPGLASPAPAPATEAEPARGPLQPSPPPDPSPPPPDPPAPEDSAPVSMPELAARLIAQGPPTLVAEPLAVGAPPPVTPPPAAAPGGAAGPACDIAGALQAALQEDTAVGDALQRVPRQARSVANAIMLWDGRWADPATLGGPEAVGPVQAAILGLIQVLPPACRDLPVKGPRFIFLTARSPATTVVLGSGEWRWSDLILAEAAP